MSHNGNTLSSGDSLRESSQSGCIGSISVIGNVSLEGILLAVF